MLAFRQAVRELFFKEPEFDDLAAHGGELGPQKVAHVRTRFAIVAPENQLPIRSIRLQDTLWSQLQSQVEKVAAGADG